MIGGGLRGDSGLKILELTPPALRHCNLTVGRWTLDPLPCQYHTPPDAEAVVFRVLGLVLIPLWSLLAFLS
jgi:hypothetical protein